MNILIVADAYPMPDRHSADFRLSRLLGMLREKYKVFFYVLGEKRQTAEIGEQQTLRYREALQSSGIGVLDGSIRQALVTHDYGAVLFEWFFVAPYLIDEVRVWQPGARVIVDTIDVVFNRFEAKARLTKLAPDITRAAETKRSELATYARADLVITITDADASILRRENSRIATFTVPNIHPLQDHMSISQQHPKLLVFVGSFTHEPNVDAMLYFCKQVLPLIIETEPDVKLRIIGNAPTPEIIQLASDHVEVLGFVPDIKPYLKTSAISIAPLRFGGGMKGKIGEAMSFGLPVVTTSTGIEGFGLRPGHDALVGDTPQDFAEAVIKLLQDRNYREQVRMAGYKFICDHYSEPAVRQRVLELFEQLDRYPLKRLPAIQVWQRKARIFWQQRVVWRFKRYTRRSLS